MASITRQRDGLNLCVHWFQGIQFDEKGLVRFLGAFAKLRKETISFVVCLSVRLSVRPSVPLTAWNNSDLTGWIFTKCDI